MSENPERPSVRLNLTFQSRLNSFTADDLINDMSAPLQPETGVEALVFQFVEKQHENWEFCANLLRQSFHGIEPETLVRSWRDEDKCLHYALESAEDFIKQGMHERVSPLYEMVLSNWDVFEPRQTALWFAAKYISHWKKIDAFEELKHWRARDREISLLGKT